MKLSTLFTLGAIAYFIFGIPFFLIPGTMLSLYVNPVPVEASNVARMTGAAYLGLGVLLWLARNSGPSEARRAIVLAGVAGAGIGTVAALWIQFTGPMSAFGWTTVIINLVFALAFAYFAFMKGEEMAAA